MSENIFTTSLSRYAIEAAKREMERDEFPESPAFWGEIEFFRRESKVESLLSSHERIHGLADTLMANAAALGLRQKLVDLIAAVDKRMDEACQLEYEIVISHTVSTNYKSTQCEICLQLTVEVSPPIEAAYEPPNVTSVVVIGRHASGECNFRKEIVLREMQSTSSRRCWRGNFDYRFQLTREEWASCHGSVWFDVEFEDYFSKRHKKKQEMFFTVEADAPLNIYTESTLQQEKDEPFVGRTDKLSKIVDAIQRSHGGKGFIITGPRRIGKSSFLHRVESEFLGVSTQIKVKYVNCLSIGHSDFGDLLSIFENALDLGDLPYPNDSAEKERMRRNRVLRELASSSGVLALELDEFSEFYVADRVDDKQYEKELIKIEDFLRGVLDGGLCNLILSVQDFFVDVQRRKNRYTLPIIRLGMLTVGELRQLGSLVSVKSAGGIAYERFDDNAIAWLHDFTGGSPLFAQMACKRAMALLKILNVQVVDLNICHFVEETLVPNYNTGEFLSPEFRLLMRGCISAVEMDGSPQDANGRAAELSDQNLCRRVATNECVCAVEPRRDFESFFNLRLKGVKDEQLLFDFYCCLTDACADDVVAAMQAKQGGFLVDKPFWNVAHGLLQRGIIEEVTTSEKKKEFRIVVRVFARWFALHRADYHLSDF